MKTKRLRCDQCQLVRINGTVCHETGCPDSWRFITKECKCCGRTFRPARARQECCSGSCRRSLYS